MGFLDSLTAGGRYRKDVAEWKRQVDLSTQILQYVASGKPAVAAPISLGRNEDALLNWHSIGLLEPRGSVVSDFGGMSHRSGDNRYFIGRSMSHQGNEVPTVVDRGELVITTQRLVFLGSTKTVEWKFGSLIGLTHSPDKSWTAIHASGRMKLRGIQHGTGNFERFQFFLGLGRACFDNDFNNFAYATLRDANALRANPPEPPAGIEADPAIQSALTQPLSLILNGVHMSTEPEASAGIAGERAEESPNELTPETEGSEASKKIDTVDTAEPTGLPAPVPREQQPVSVSPGGVASVDLNVAVRIVIAGVAVDDPSEIANRYASENGLTLLEFDLAAGTFATIRDELVRRTRIVNSRISEEEGTWFVERGRTAPWHLVPSDAQLRDADPTEEHGLYDDAVDLWSHFSTQWPRGVRMGKLSKVLYLMRPGMFPILDSRLQSAYRLRAAEVAHEVAARRPSLGKAKRMYWEAVRRDLVASQQGLAVLRSCLSQNASDSGLAKVSDLRLLDVLAWKSGIPEAFEGAD